MNTQINGILAAHFRGDWSDGTYSCQGCRQRYEDAGQARFDAMDQQPTRDELIAFRNGYSDVSKPNWTIADYNAHVAGYLADLYDSALFTARISAVQTAQRVLAGEDTVEWARTAKGSSIALSYVMEALDSLIDDLSDPDDQWWADEPATSLAPSPEEARDD